MKAPTDPLADPCATPAQTCRVVGVAGTAPRETDDAPDKYRYPPGSTDAHGVREALPRSPRNPLPIRGTYPHHRSSSPKLSISPVIREAAASNARSLPAVQRRRGQLVVYRFLELEVRRVGALLPAPIQLSLRVMHGASPEGRNRYLERGQHLSAGLIAGKHIRACVACM